LLISVSLFGLDRWTKHLVTVNLKGQPPWPEGWNLIYFHYAENYHMAFSLTLLKMPMVNLLAVGASLFILYYLWNYKDISWMPSVGMAGILGGALGNLSERFTQGYVVDWISTEWPDWLLFHRWPSFNVADASIFCGIALYLIYVFFFEKQKPVVEPAPEEAD
jgi:signal peptidase II